MHLNKLLEQIKRHQSPTEAIDKLATALEKHEGSLLEKGFTILKSELAANMYEAINGPHFDEEHARYAVEGMENEDGTKGPHWTVEETTSVANQMGINLKSEKHNKWDWYVAMNMIYSDYYKAVVAMTGSANTKHFAELAKAWLCDKDIDEGKMWHYYVYLMCDDDENDYKAYERMHSNRNSYYSPEYEHRMGREKGYDYEARSYQYPYSRYDREELDRDSKRYREAVNAGDCNVIKAISGCCCTTQRSIDSVNLNLTQMNADNRLSICQQTNTLQNAITSGFNTLSSENATRFNILGAKIDAQTQIINDKFCQLISCDGEQRKLSVSEDKTMMTDSNIGLTIATEKSQIINMVRQSLEDCRIKKESLSKIDEEMRRCEDILKILNVNSDITTNVTKDFKELDELRAEVKELKQLLQNISTVRPEENNIDPPTEEKENEI